MPKPGHHSKFFPGKLRIMLDQVDGLGLSHGSSWVSEGRAFAIHDPDTFMTDIAPQFFDKQTHLRSFHRQLSIWGFTRLETGAGGRGVWFHKNFIRDKPEMIKHIKRVPVKNPKPTIATPKNQLPDYTNYQLPVSFHQDSLHSARGPHSSMTKPVPVHHPHRNNPAVKDGAPESKVLPAVDKNPMPLPPSESLDYISALGRMPPTVDPRFFQPHNPAMPVPVGNAPPMVSDQAHRYPPFVLSNYQPSVVTSMNHLPAHSLSNPNVPSSDLDEVAQQLMAYRNNPSQNRNSNLNDAFLARFMESRRMGNPAANNGTGVNGQEFLSAIALRNNLFPHGPKSS